MVSSFRLLFSKLISILAPARCMQCLAESAWLCQECLPTIRPVPLACMGCKKDSPRGMTCPDCIAEIPLTGLVSVASYSSPYIRRAIRWLKFKGVQDVAAPLAHLAAARLAVIAPLHQLVSQAILVPIPLHPSRARQRGFNQSQLLASHISSLTGIPMQDTLERARATHTQAKLPHELRSRNTTGAFNISPLHKGELEGVVSTKRYLILVDDVATSGATLAAAAKTLRPHFSGDIWAVTVARG